MLDTNEECENTVGYFIKRTSLISKKHLPAFKGLEELFRDLAL